VRIQALFVAQGPGKNEKEIKAWILPNPFSLRYLNISLQKMWNYLKLSWKSTTYIKLMLEINDLHGLLFEPFGWRKTGDFVVF
jgi:hypothetical protein